MAALVSPFFRGCIPGGDSMRSFSFREQSDSLENLLSQQEWVAISCTAEWSGPCRYISTEFAALAKTFREVLAIELDTDRNPETVLALEIASLPTVLMYRRGQELQRFVGMNACREWAHTFASQGIDS